MESLHRGALVGKDVRQPRVLRRRLDVMQRRPETPGEDQENHGAARQQRHHTVVLAGETCDGGQLMSCSTKNGGSPILHLRSI